MLDTLDIVVLTALLGGIIYFLVGKLKPKQNSSSLSLNRQASTVVSNAPSIADFDGDIVELMKTAKKNCVVFFGSQTGTAENYAEILQQEASDYGFSAVVADPQDNRIETLERISEIENSLAIFCIATYGEGDPTDNAQEMFDYLKDQVENKDLDLSGLKYTVFGLGNRTYEEFNVAAQFIDSALETLGGTRVYDIGLGDDDQNIEEDFVKWKTDMWVKVCETYDIDPATAGTGGGRRYENKLPPPRPDRIFSGETHILNSFSRQKRPFTQKNPFLAKVSVRRELFKDAGEDSCVHLELDIQNSGIRYSAGDHVAVYPTNESSIVERLGKRLNTDLDELLNLVAVDEYATKKNPFPQPCTYRTALSHYVDITSNASTYLLHTLAQYAEGADKTRLELLASRNGSKEYAEYVKDGCRNIEDVLNDFPSLAPPMDHLLEVLPRLQIRYYSISSSPKEHPHSIHVTAAIVKYTTPTGRKAKGVATNYLDSLDLTSGRVPIFVREASFRLPVKSTLPVLMIGPGTGLAPFRGFLQERRALANKGRKVGANILYFGCRYEAKNFIYRDELEEMKTDGTLTELHVAFSRDQKEKVYVQHLLKKNAESVWNHIEEGGHLYVCGDAKHMAADVHEEIVNCVQRFGNKSEEEAKAFVKQLANKKRLQQDVWS